MAELVDPDLLTSEFFEELEKVCTEDDKKSKEPKRSFELDDAFFAELDELVDADFRNCGTGAVGGKQGFQPGNKCAGDGEKSKAKAEGKKKNVHSDWDDGKTAAEAGWFWTEKKFEPSGNPFDPPVRNTVKHKGLPENESKGAANEFTTDKGKEVWTRLYPVTSDSSPTREVEFAVDGDISVTNGGEAMSIIRGVSNNIVSMYNDENIDGISFSSLRMDGSGRARLYASLSKRIAKKTDSEAFASIKNMQSGRKTPETKFYVVKKSALKKFKKNPTVFPTDGDLFDPKPVTGRPVGKWHTVPIDDFDWGTAFEKQYSEEERSSEEKSKPWFLDELLKDESFVEQVEKMLESEETRSVDFDDAFFAELDELVDADFRNCGTGAVGGKQGFQPGNKCAGTGEKTKGKAEGKENKKGSAPSSDLFPSGSQGFRTAVDDVTTASGLNSDDIWDRSKGFRDLPDRSKIEAFAKEQQSKSGKPMTPAGRKAYDALIDDIGTQYQALTDAGLKVYAWEGKGEPYAKVPGGTKVDSNMMRKMVAKDGEFRFFMTDKGFGTGAATKNHPMLKMTKYKTSDGKPLIANDLFRVVHDMVAHVRGGHSFSTKGEFNGMLTHATTLNKKAWPALFSETFAQNSVYEITNKFAPQNAYGSRKGASLIKVELDNIMKDTESVERAVPSGDSDEPLGYWHLKQRPWLVDKLSKDEPSEQEKENG